MTRDMEYKMEKETALVEAILYLETEPLDEASLARISGLSKEIIDDVLANLKERYQDESHGVEIIQISGGWAISPKKELWESLKDRYGKKNDNRLSRAAMETLSIIAYSQPITRGEIEALRGVSADNMIRLLIERNLIKEVGKKDIPGKPVQFGTTKEFLKLFRLNSIADLPKLDETESDRFELAR
jgi:segregation and condensation protein B